MGEYNGEDNGEKNDEENGENTDFAPPQSLYQPLI